jgi:hypothetical protein
MQETRSTRGDRCLLGLAVGCAIVLHGCGGSTDNEVIQPKQSPKLAGKATVESYLADMKAQKKANPNKPRR